MILQQTSCGILSVAAAQPRSRASQCTTKFSFKIFYVLAEPCFVWISEQTAISAFYSINWSNFITDRESVYCAVRSDLILNRLRVVLKGLCEEI